MDETRALEPVRPKEQVARGLGMRGHGAERGAIAGAGGGAQLSATNRLLKEYRRLLRQPAPGIEAHPLETNILEWHFLLRCDAPPYGPQGEYHGALEFPPACKEEHACLTDSRVVCLPRRFFIVVVSRLRSLLRFSVRTLTFTNNDASSYCLFIDKKKIKNKK